MSKPGQTLSNLQQIIAFVYGSLTKIWTAVETEKESCVADEGKTNHLLEMSNIFDQVILLLKQAMNSCSYSRRFNVLMLFFEDKKKSGVHAKRQCYSILRSREFVILA